MLPLTLLKAAENSHILIELKNGDTYNGTLVSCNLFMNINLRDVVCTSRDGDRFWKLNECYVRGNSIKYLRIPDEILQQVPETTTHYSGGRRGGGRGGDNQGRGDGAGRGRGRVRSEGRGEGRGGRGNSGEGRGGRGNSEEGRGGRGGGRGGDNQGRGDGAGRGRGGGRGE